ncbi:MAG TPA: hypothetical protein VLZ54_02705, partial [Arenibacter sp.]|nr:hypothetical protein [Arenibacter sp.]
MTLRLMAGSLFLLGTLISCNEKKEAEKPLVAKEQGFDYKVDRFADIQVLRYRIPGFEELALKEKKLVYYLTQAGLSGRDIIWDQNYRHNLTIREALENIHTHFTGDRTSGDWKAFEEYLKRVWFSNGIHHHYSNDKIMPGFSSDYLTFLLGETDTELKGEAFEVIFNDQDNKKVNKKKGVDIVAASAVNFYDSTLTDDEVEAFYKTAYKGPADRPIEAGLNSTLVRENGELVEKVWKSGGLYGSAIDEIIEWLEKARGVAENQKQADALGLLIEYYKTGSLDTWDKYCIAWATSTEGNIDWINGFIEVYNDPKGYRGSYESIVQIKDFEMSRQMAVLSENV